MNAAVSVRSRMLALAVAAAVAGSAPAAQASASDSGVAAVPLPHTVARPGQEQVLKLGYSVYLGGLNAFAFTADLALNGDTYSITTSGESKGMLRLMWKWAASLTAGGRVEPEGVNAQVYNVRTLSRRGDKTMHLSFDENGKYSVRRNPPDTEYRKTKRGKLPQMVPQETLDPLSIALRVAQSVTEGKGCSGTFPVFDGDRRYDLTFTDLGVQELKPNPYTVFAGAANRCRFEMERIAGFEEKRENFRFWDEDDLKPPEIWVAQVVPNMPPVPVRMHGDLSLGGLRIYLVWAEYAGRPVYADGERPQVSDIAKN